MVVLLMLLEAVHSAKTHSFFCQSKITIKKLATALHVCVHLARQVSPIIAIVQQKSCDANALFSSYVGKQAKELCFSYCSCFVSKRHESNCVHLFHSTRRTAKLCIFSALMFHLFTFFTLKEIDQ